MVKRQLRWVGMLLLLVACGKPPREVALHLVTDAAEGIELDSVHVEPASAVLERRREPHGIALRVRAAGSALVVTARGACPVELSPEELDKEGRLTRPLQALFDFGPSTRVVGYEQSFELRAVPRCKGAESARVEFTRMGGALLTQLGNREGGRLFSARTRPPDQLGRTAFGVVPVSASRRAATEIRARVTLEDGTRLERRLEVTAGTRATGLPNVAVDHAVLIAGDAVRLTARPEGSQATLRDLGGIFELVPDLGGAYGVRDAAQHALDLEARRYDETPLDCGRCHQALSASANQSAMASALAADLGGRHPLAAPECALACHTTGEPGRRDGGFSHLLAELGGTGTLPERFEALPAVLQRLGGVGCLACHGPGAVPEASARWAVLRNDVCAVCHDAPPRYGHVAAFATSRMALSDHDLRQRDDPSCARCHTTWGALGRPERKPPPEAGAFGITCAACHDAHPHGEPGSGEHASAGVDSALLRETKVPSVLDATSAAVRGPSRVCLDCHAPDGERANASAAAIWAGRGGVDPETGQALVAAAPHAVESRGCLGCHDGGPDTLSFGKGHAFDAPSTTCARCHSQPIQRSSALAARARALLEKLRPDAKGAAGAGPPHASLTEVALSPLRQRALFDTLLVLEDPAADVHNPAYAALLLERAERALALSPPSRRR